LKNAKLYVLVSLNAMSVCMKFVYLSVIRKDLFPEKIQVYYWRSICKTHIN